MFSVSQKKHVMSGGCYCLVLMDYYSRYPEVEMLQSITSTTIINKLFKIFSVHGYLREVISDNGRQFVSDEMENLLAEHGIKHRRGIPYWACANGLVENFNKTLKKAIQAACLARKDWKMEIYKILLTFRTTPSCATNKSPSSLHFQREIRTKLPSVDKGSPPDKVREMDARRKTNHEEICGQTFRERLQMLPPGTESSSSTQKPRKVGFEMGKRLLHRDRTVWAASQIMFSDKPDIL